MILAVDTETTGTDVFHGCGPFLITACDGETNYWFQGTVNPYTRDVFWEEDVLAEVTELLTSAHKLVFHNTNFDMRMLASTGLDIEPLWPKVEDTLLASHCICSGDTHGLKDLAIKYLDYWNDDELILEEAVKLAIKEARQQEWKVAKLGDPHFPGLMGVTSWWKMDYWLVPEVCIDYGIGDVERTWLLWDAFKYALLEDNLFPVYNTRKQLLRIVYDMCTAGKNFYADTARELITTYTADMEILRWEIKGLADIKYRFDPNKREHLIDLIHYRSNIPISFYTKGDAPATDKKAIDAYEQASSLPALKKLAEYRSLSSKVQHINSYLRWTDDKSRIHSNINITGTRETRQSSTSPNIQNIDKEIATLFGPPPGKVWLCIDMVNIELRIWAYSVKNKELIEIFERGESVHLHIMTILFPDMAKRYKEYGKKDTQAAACYVRVKSGTFAGIYGATDYKIDETYNGYKEGPACWSKVDKRFPGIKEFTKTRIEMIYTNMNLYSTPSVHCMGGYRLDVPLSEPFKACNYYVQGTAGWIMTLAMIAVAKNPEYLGYGCKMIAQVHDSLDIEIPIHPRLQRIIDSICLCIEEAGRTLIPTCDVSYEVMSHEDDHDNPIIDNWIVPF